MPTNLKCCLYHRVIIFTHGPVSGLSFLLLHWSSCTRPTWRSLRNHRILLFLELCASTQHSSRPCAGPELSCLISCDMPHCCPSEGGGNSPLLPWYLKGTLSPLHRSGSSSGVRLYLPFFTLGHMPTIRPSTQFWFQLWNSGRSTNFQLAAH